MAATASSIEPGLKGLPHRRALGRFAQHRHGF
jgi:hypothetical protein